MYLVFMALTPVFTFFVIWAARNVRRVNLSRAQDPARSGTNPTISKHSAAPNP
jgi:hypothetical protein